MPPEEEDSLKNKVDTKMDSGGKNVDGLEDALHSKQEEQLHSEEVIEQNASASSTKLISTKMKLRERRAVSYASSSLEDPLSPSSSTSQNIDSDGTFDSSVEMMVDDFDEEHTLNEEEALAQEYQDPQDEIDTLREESDMPLEELLAKYQAIIPSVEVSRKLSKKSTKRVKSKSENQSSNSNKEDDNIEDDSEQNEEMNVNTSESGAEDEVDANSGDNFNEHNENDAITPETPVEKKNLKRSRLLVLYPEQAKEGGYEIESSADEENKPRKTLKVGVEHQAVIPVGLSQYGDILPYENEDKLIWEPSQVSEQEVEEYLLKVRDIKPMLGEEVLKMKPTDESKLREPNVPQNSTNNISNGTDNVPQRMNTDNKLNSSGAYENDAVGIVKDNEQALHLLVQCGYDFNEALRRKRLNVVPLTGSMSLWSEEECQKFEEGIQKFGKDFLKIRQNQVRTRTMRELVQFFYLWKKSERSDHNYTNSSTVDHMDIYLNEEDDFGPNNSSSSCATGLPSTTNNTYNTRRSSNTTQNNFSIMTGNNADTLLNSQSNASSKIGSNKKQKSIVNDEASSSVATFGSK